MYKYNRVVRSLKMNETNPEQRVNFDRKRTGQFLTLAMIVASLIVVLTQMGNNFDYLHRLHFLASFLYMS